MNKELFDLIESGYNQHEYCTGENLLPVIDMLDELGMLENCHIEIVDKPVFNIGDKNVMAESHARFDGVKDKMIYLYSISLLDDRDDYLYLRAYMTDKE